MFSLVLCLSQEWQVVCQRVCAGFISSCYGECWEWRVWGFLAFLRCLVHMEGASFASILPFCVQGLGHIGVPPAGHPLRAEVGGSITFVTSGGECLAAQRTACYYFGIHVIVMILGATFASLSGTAQSPWL